MNQESESYRQDLYMRIGVMKDTKTKPEESTEAFLMSYILRDVSFTEVGSVCRVALREPMNLLCACVSEEGGDVYWEELFIMNQILTPHTDTIFYF